MWIKVFSAIRDPRKRIECLIISSTIVAGYFYIYIHQNMLHIEIPLISYQTLITMPIVTLVAALALYLFVKSDPLQRSPSNKKAIRFFQNEFPSKYILQRCDMCIEDESSCKNYIKPESFAHVRYWFKDIFHGIIEQQDPTSVTETFEKGYNCKLVYYLKWVMISLLVLSVLTATIHHIFLYFEQALEFDFTNWQILFPVICIMIIVLITVLNRVDDVKPSGCWQAWRQINRMHVSWLKSNENILIGLICHNNEGTKHFVKK